MPSRLSLSKPFRAALFIKLFLNPVVQAGDIEPLFADDTTNTPSSGGSYQAKGAQTVVDVFKGDTAVEDVNQEGFFRAADGSNTGREEPPQDVVAAALWITRPKNDTVLPVGNVVLAFETRGFTPSVETPIEVVVPQNGDTPTLLESGNVFTLSMDMPCTQVITLSATTVLGQHLSTSVLFSTMQDKTTILSARAPLPTDAAWGPRSEAVPSRSHQLEGNKSAIRREANTDADRKHDTKRLVDGGGGLDTPQQQLESGVGTKGPISLVFVGSLSLDGQKHIWLQQMEHLSRTRFVPTYLTFEAGGEGGGTDNSTAAEERASAWKTNAVESFTHRLRRAGVPLVKVRLPQVDESWIFDTSSSSGERVAPANVLKEVVFTVVLESMDRAGGEPRSMSPPWARQVVERIADAIKSVSPDVLVVANGKTLGDAVLTRAARWAMSGEFYEGRIVMDFPNIEPAQGVDVDVLTTPSHYVARHPDTEGLATATGARVVVIPPGVKAASSVLFSANDTIGDDAETPPDGNPGGFLVGATCDRGVLAKLGCCDPDCHVVGFAGRLAPEKGPGLFMAVAEVVSRLIPSAVFVVVGDGPLRLALEATAERLGISRRAYFAGWASEGDDLYRLLAGMSLLFNPSLSPSETFSIINIQAMLAGTPVAAFGAAGMLEYLSPDVNALLLDDPEPRAIATAIAELLLDRPRLDALAARGRLDVALSFGADTALNRWADLYETLARRGDGDGGGGETEDLAGESE